MKNPFTYLRSIFSDSGRSRAAPRFDSLGELYETLHEMAIRDPLTRVYNRSLFEDRLKLLIAEHRRSPTTAAILLIDMVRFKYVNDLLGHLTGDQLLKQVVVRISDVLRESDTLARLGGDEFTVILPETGRQDAIQVAEKIIQSMQGDFDVEGNRLSVSVNIGIALLPLHGDEVETLVRRADYAMYSARDGHTGYAVYNDEVPEQVDVTRARLQGNLREDIKQNDLFLVYQPVIDFKSGKVSYLEVLVRWRQPDGTILMPDRFIRAAEQSGLIKQLTEWIIETACREFSTVSRNYPDLRFGINLSMHNLHDFGLVKNIQASLDKHGLKPETMLLEITETGVMLDPEQVGSMLEKLAAIGLRFSIDDFGTGYSSLVYLKRLPVHNLKVDKSFVTEMDIDEDNASIVRATIDLAHSLGLTVTAEGVETRAVHEMLGEMGCDYFQGYFAEKPIVMDDMVTWLSARIQGSDIA